MDVGALIVDEATLARVSTVLEALADPCRSYGVDLGAIRFAFSAHRDLGPRLIIHVIHPATGDSSNLPYDFFVNLEEPDGFGAVLSSAIQRRVGGYAPYVWTCLYERRSGAWIIHTGVMETAEKTDRSDGDAALRRLATRLGAADVDLLRTKLEQADTEQVDASSPLSSRVLEALRSRLVS